MGINWGWNGLTVPCLIVTIKSWKISLSFESLGSGKYGRSQRKA